MNAELGRLRRALARRLVIVAAVVWVAWVCSGAELSTLASGSGASLRALGSGAGLLDLSPQMRSRAVELAGQTLSIALWGTALGASAGFVLSLGASDRIVCGGGGRRTLGSRLVLRGCRWTLDVLRAVPDFAWALAVMIVVGPGPITGTIAIGLSVTGMLGRSYSQLYDTVDPLAVRAAETTAAPRLLVALYGYVPAAAPSLLSYTLLRLECSIRNASVIGIVGGGGLGAALFEELGFGRYDRVATLLLVLLVLTGVADILAKRLAAGLASRRVTRRQVSAGASIVLAIAALALWPHVRMAIEELGRIDTTFLGQTIEGLMTVGFTMGGLQRLLADAAVVAGVAIVATALAVAGAWLVMLLVVRRIDEAATAPSWRRVQRMLARLVDAAALVFRGIPDVAWLLLFSVVFSVGPLAAIFAIGLHSLGLLLRLFVESVDGVSRSKLALARGATPRSLFVWIIWPDVSPAFWTHVGVLVESNLRAGVVVGIVGAGGLGDAFHTSLSFWRLGDATLQLAAMVGLSVLADRSARRVIAGLRRGPSLRHSS